MRLQGFRNKGFVAGSQWNRVCRPALRNDVGIYGNIITSYSDPDLRSVELLPVEQEACTCAEVQVMSTYLLLNPKP